jgi:hypothetical protein
MSGEAPPTVANKSSEAWPITAAAPQRIRTVFPIVRAPGLARRNLSRTDVYEYPMFGTTSTNFLPKRAFSFPPTRPIGLVVPALVPLCQVEVAKLHERQSLSRSASQGISSHSCQLCDVQPCQKCAPPARSIPQTMPVVIPRVSLEAPRKGGRTPRQNLRPRLDATIIAAT